MKGWISIHRKFKDWEWYSDSKIVHLFLHCLLKANHKSKQWQGQTIETGQFITSQSHLAAETHLTVMQVRTILNKLKLTGELTVKITNKYSIISITNWESYQGDNRQVNTPVTIKQQSNNTQVTTNNNNNNVNNENKEKPPMSKPAASTCPFDDIIDLYHETLINNPKVVKLSVARKAQIKARWNNGIGDIDAWKRYFELVGESKFLTGQEPPGFGRNKPFIADIDFLIKENNVLKIVEGKYHG